MADADRCKCIRASSNILTPIRISAASFERYSAFSISNLSIFLENISMIALGLWWTAIRCKWSERTRDDSWRRIPTEKRCLPLISRAVRMTNPSLHFSYTGQSDKGARTRNEETDYSTWQPYSFPPMHYSPVSWLEFFSTLSEKCSTLWSATMDGRDLLQSYSWMAWIFFEYLQQNSAQIKIFNWQWLKLHSF